MNMMNKNNDYSNLVTNEGLEVRRKQLFQAQKDDFTNALVAAIDASNALGLDHSVELLLDSMIDDFSKEELDFNVANYRGESK
tara:strand:+ start:424 stop:672 length:249 start_codon:yes stop_codon:yes gene_type:complete